MRELVLLGALWGVYSLSRLIASAEPQPALARARALLSFEQNTGLDLERGLNRFVVQHEWLGVAASFYYAAAHYLVTAAVLVALWAAGRPAYRRARNALVLATVIALSVYLTLPTAPPRFLPGYTDVLASSARLGWWSHGDSLPGGLGRMTNELAAMPSMHAGWALWVALALHLVTTNRLLRGLGWLHAVLTAAVVVGTANHWLADVAAGWLVVAAAWVVVGYVVRTVGARSAAGSPAPGDGPVSRAEAGNRRP
ncbi:phosphatase PAP2 family protein [Kineosporia succinea]|uniref:Inositolphosphotransferase Aur1/Ipt1 domain-containing protein n=1 Tax=Kineosporia succinea TaxID=84632 RepID=A0ABT9P0G4_9ACTN|nr:phosphatase PAP2 family protein [Kineosporia succinea]MDP9826166.1 hypothetical protein [Kineosporia succinea]